MYVGLKICHKKYTELRQIILNIDPTAIVPINVIEEDGIVDWTFMKLNSQEAQQFLAWFSIFIIFI